MTALNSEYATCEKMLAALAWESAQRNGLRFDDCLSECHVAFMAAQSAFDPARGVKLSTLVCGHARNRLRHFAWKQRKAGGREPNLTDITRQTEAGEAGIPQPAVSAEPGSRPAMERAESLSDEARELVALLVETPAELLEEAIRTPRELMAAARRHLLGRGWSRDRFFLTCAEIRTHFRREWAA